MRLFNIVNLKGLGTFSKLKFIIIVSLSELLGKTGRFLNLMEIMEENCPYFSWLKKAKIEKCRLIIRSDDLEQKLKHFIH